VRHKPSIEQATTSKPVVAAHVERWFSGERMSFGRASMHPAAQNAAFSL